MIISVNHINDQITRTENFINECKFFIGFHIDLFLKLFSWIVLYSVQCIINEFTIMVHDLYFLLQDSWESVNDIINWFGMDVHRQSAWAAPGHFNDADMLDIGNFGERVISSLFA